MSASNHLYQKKMSRGKGTKKDLTGFDSITIVSIPALPERVELLERRYSKGLDLWTGLPLRPEILRNEDKEVIQDFIEMGKLEEPEPEMYSCAEHWELTDDFD
jgi:hypothetical protein